MDWYIPITIVPGIGMFVLSTTSQMMSLSAEIGQLLKECKNDFQHHIADLKILQLTRLTRAATLLYSAAALFVLSGIWGAIYEASEWSEWILFAGVASTFVAMGILINYSYHTIKIRKKQHQHIHTK
ncbi:hypothetical protein [Galbibacter mesophilus]|uniref:hypothetical protein n=1 Tax=Galbibacter mesophilus TaxID=379069 RepID=UPI00191E6DC6|nr:hypothetical protein [Galbibacter mesophilus]MCM5664171.1 hypothetical protein [Galbibacter mesophilus]